MKNFKLDNLIIYGNKKALIEGACQRLTEAIQEAIERQNKCAVALSGGNSPRSIYKRLVQEPFCSQIDWKKVHLFWGDERCVPPDHPDSNYRMVKEAMLTRIPIPEDNVHRILAELPPKEAARQYEEELKFFFEAEEPVFDIILLGLGTDGHTASLFPQTPVIFEKERWVSEVYIPKLDSWRITLTLPIINGARKIFFLIVGNQKAEIVEKIQKLDQPTPQLPASLVVPRNGELWWLLDRDAALRLNLS